MKRANNLYSKIISIDNLRLADKKAAKGKSGQSGVIMHRRSPDTNLLNLHHDLINKSFTTSKYNVFKVRDPKERDVYSLPYFPDRIVHHAVMNVMEPIFVSSFTADTYSCIKGKGIMGAKVAVEKALRDVDSTTYCLKLDIKKFYPNIDHNVLKTLLRRKIKDKDLLWLLDNIIDSASGVPIGNYLSQYFANFYLAYFDHWIKEHLRVKYYFRYADDLVILSPSKPYLHKLLADIKDYLRSNLKLTVKENYQVFPVASRSIDFVGYRFYHTHTLMRKGIKKNLARAIAKGNNPQSIAAYYGWAKHCDTINLLKKLKMKNFKDLGVKPNLPAMQGDKIKVDRILNREITVHSFQIKESKFDRGNGKCLYMQIEVDQQKRVLFTGSGVLMDTIQQIPVDSFPFITTIVKENDRFQFT
ncbi:MAG: reverse transcriptase [Bacteroidia bacterium]|nr:reverse transcriptase [Bacteroidia bacterium]